MRILDEDWVCVCKEGPIQNERGGADQRAWLSAEEGEELRGQRRDWDFDGERFDRQKGFISSPNNAYHL